MEFISRHPILEKYKKKEIGFTFNGKNLVGFEDLVISSALFLNKIKIFGHHVKDLSPQGIFCANGQCSQCNVIANGIPVKACMTSLVEGMVIESCDGLPELPFEDDPVDIGDSEVIDIEFLVIGAGPAGLSAIQTLGKSDRTILLVDDKDRLGGKLVLQTHKFFGSQEDVYAGKRGNEIAKILGDSIKLLPNVQIWLNSVCLAVFSDGF
ncbi:MAG: 2Fe-2S iron-sulfur cluster-binding protein, partial [Promethearchaeota archaeon]